MLGRLRHSSFCSCCSPTCVNGLFYSETLLVVAFSCFFGPPVNRRVTFGGQLRLVVHFELSKICGRHKFSGVLALPVVEEVLF